MTGEGLSLAGEFEARAFARFLETAAGPLSQAGATWLRMGMNSLSVAELLDTVEGNIGKVDFCLSCMRMAAWAEGDRVLYFALFAKSAELGRWVDPPVEGEEE